VLTGTGLAFRKNAQEPGDRERNRNRGKPIWFEKLARPNKTRAKNRALARDATILPN